jgi:hypothetical protein
MGDYSTASTPVMAAFALLCAGGIVRRNSVTIGREGVGNTSQNSEFDQKPLKLR